MTTNEYIANVKNNKYPPFDEKIWQRNYFEHIIRDENDYITKAEYILNNPLKWEMEHRYGYYPPEFVRLQKNHKCGNK